MVQQELARALRSVELLGALGRELPNYLDVNLDPTTRRRRRLPSLMLPERDLLGDGNDLPDFNLYKIWQHEPFRLCGHGLPVYYRGSQQY